MTVVVVAINESKDSLIKRSAVFLRLDINIVIFFSSPKPFNPDVVLCSAMAVHTDPHFRMLCTRSFPIQAGELTILIRVYDFRCPILRNGVFEPLYAVRRILCVKCLALFQGLYGHLHLKHGVVLLSAFLHGAKLLLIILGTCLK